MNKLWISARIYATWILDRISINISTEALYATILAFSLLILLAGVWWAALRMGELMGVLK